MVDFVTGLSKCFKSVPGVVFAVAVMAVDAHFVMIASETTNVTNIAIAVTAVIATIVLMLIIRYIGVIGMFILVFIIAMASTKYYDAIRSAISALKL